MKLQRKKEFDRRKEMNEEHRDAEEVLMVIKKATMFADPIMKIATIGLAKIVQFLARMVKEKIIDKRAFKNFQNFAKRTEGNFDVYNIPIDQIGDDIKLEDIEEFKDLKAKGVRFYEMPDLNKSDNYIQIAVCRDDEEVFNLWYQRYLDKKMAAGGKKTEETLNAFTEGKTSIVNVPFEGKENIYKEDFAKLKINYSVLPDLKVGDGYIQLILANRDIPKVQQWYQLYQKDMLKQGEKVPDLNVIDMSTYRNTGKMSTDEYINTGDEKVKAANEKYEKEKETSPKIPLSEGEKTYEDYESDQMYQKFTIDPDTLVNSLDKSAVNRFEPEFFVSRIPGTYGENIQYLVVYKDQVFRSEDSKYYTVFLRKDEQPLIYDKSLQHPIKRPYAEQLYQEHYDLSEKEQKATQFSQQKGKQTAKNTAQKKPVKAPKPPLKTK